MKTYVHLGFYLTEFFRRKSDHSLYSIFFPPEIVPFMTQCSKYSRAKQSKDDNMAYALCMLDN